MPEITIREAPEAQEIAEELIPAYHPHLEHAKILYLFTSQKRRRNDKTVLATAAKLSALQRYLSSGTDGSVLAGYDFIVLIGHDQWGFREEPARRALVDHELCHCIERIKLDKLGREKRSWGLRGHDVEEFREVIERHGLWQRDVRHFAEAVQQLPLEARNGQPALVPLR